MGARAERAAHALTTAFPRCAAAKKMGIEHPGCVLKCFANDSQVHNLVVCTLWCAPAAFAFALVRSRIVPTHAGSSCYPVGLLGRSPYWYKSRAYRARAVRDPRRLLKVGRARRRTTDSDDRQ